MKKIAVIFSNGTEEIEALTPVDVLRRTGAQCDIVSVSGEHPVGSHGITVKADKTDSELDMDLYDAIVIPGGMPGAEIISQNDNIIRALKKAFIDGKVVASICASPAVVLAKHGLIAGKRATCYPADVFISLMSATNYTASDVERDGLLITANGPKSAMKFALEICSVLNLTPKF
jgi:4-methyl-5(b-hydroxyethyl)-thiazole monophosphate biosynthesis